MVLPDGIQPDRVVHANLFKCRQRGCRVRMDRHDPAAVSVQLADADFGQLKDPGIRLSLLRFFRSSGIRRVLVDLEGR